MKFEKGMFVTGKPGSNVTYSLTNEFALMEVTEVYGSAIEVKILNHQTKNSPELWTDRARFCVKSELFMPIKARKTEDILQEWI